MTDLETRVRNLEQAIRTLAGMVGRNAQLIARVMKHFNENQRLLMEVAKNLQRINGRLNGVELKVLAAEVRPDGANDGAGTVVQFPEIDFNPPEGAA